MSASTTEQSRISVVSWVCEWVGEFIRDVIAVTQYSYATPTIIMIKQLK